MDAFSGHDIGQTDACGQHSHPDFALLRFGAFFFDDLQGIRTAVSGDNGALVFHGNVPSFGMETIKAKDRIKKNFLRISGAVISPLSGGDRPSDAYQFTFEPIG
jgi:hypothetical protein